jgi:hypothetical protein
MDDVTKTFETIGQIPTGPTYAHPLSEDIVRECSSLLMEIPEGRRLLKFARENDIKFNAITGREPGYQYGDAHNVFLICPANTKAVDLDEMACNLGMAIREIEQQSDGIPRPIYGSMAADQQRISFNHLLDIIYEMCKIVSEFVDAKKGTKLVDLVEKLGHGNIYRGIRSGKSKQELAEVFADSLKKRV